MSLCRHLVAVLTLAGFLAIPSPLQGPASASQVHSDVEPIIASLRPRQQIIGKDQRWSLGARMAYYNVPGVSVAVINGGRLRWAEGFGIKRLDEHAPVTPQTLFQAGSMSKPVAAFTALTLVRDGLLDLDRPINQQLVSWQLPSDPKVGNVEDVTLRTLMSHIGGISTPGFPGYKPGSQLPSILNILEGENPANTPAVRLQIAPGTVIRYSGGGYMIVQLAIQDALQGTFAEIAHDRVLKVFEMADSGFRQPLPEDKRQEIAAPHNEIGAPYADGAMVYPELAAAGLWATPTDMGKFIVGVQNAVLGKNDVLTDALVTQMFAQHPPSAFGLGPLLQQTEEGTWFSHGGSTAGYQGMFVGSMEGGYGAVVMTNADRGGALAFELLAAIADYYDWPGYLNDAVAVVDLTEIERARLAGRYEILPGIAALIEERDGALYYRLEGLPESRAERLYATGPSFLFGQESLIEMDFAGPANKQAAKVVLSFDGLRYTGQRKEMPQ